MLDLIATVLVLLAAIPIFGFLGAETWQRRIPKWTSIATILGITAGFVLVVVAAIWL